MVTLNKDTHTENIKLSIQVSLNGLSFCGLVKETKEIVFFKEINFGKKLGPVETLHRIQKLYEQEEFLKKTDREVIVLFSNELYSLVPEKLFDPKNASDYLKYNTKILETDYVAQDVLSEEGIVNVYIPYSNINNFFFEKYGEFEYQHCISILTSSFLQLNRSHSGATHFYVHCFPGGFDLVVIKNDQLLLANSFTCETKEDFIYYLLFTAEQLELDPKTLELVLLGKIRKNSDYHQMAYRYFKHLRFLETSFGFIFAAKEKPPKASVHYTLLKALQ